MFLADIFILKLITLNWMKVDYEGEGIIARSVHFSMVNRNKIYVFGGNN